MRSKLSPSVIAIAIMILLFFYYPNNTHAASFIAWPGNTIPVDYEPANIIVANDGTSYVTNNSGGIMKYLPDGTLDISWGASGRVLATIRPVYLCFDPHGDLLTGNCDAADGIMRVSAQTGMSEVILPGLIVNGIAVDAGYNIYVNTGSTIVKYTGTLDLVWSKPLKTASHALNNEMGLCLLPDGSIITSDEPGGSIVKYTTQGNVDTTFGNGGALNVASSYAGLASYDDALYVCCYNESIIKRVSIDGKNIETVMTGISPTILISKNGFYFVTNWQNQSIDCYRRPYIDVVKEQFNCIISPALPAPGSISSITLAVTSTCSAVYDISAKVFHKATNAVAADITASTATLENGDATIFLFPSNTGWKAGDYYVKIIFTDTPGSLTVSDSLRISPEITVIKRYTITFKAEGESDIVKTVTEGSMLSDVPEVPVKKGYTGVWDTKIFTNIKADQTVNAIYTRITHTITFMVEKTILAVKTIYDGSTLTSVPAVPLRKGYKGKWDTGAFINVTADMIVNAVYTLVKHKVTFKAEGVSDIIKTVYEGDTLSDIPPVPAKSGYTGSWDTTVFTDINTDMVVKAIYTRMNKTSIAKAAVVIEGVDETFFDYDTELICELITGQVDLTNTNANIGIIAKEKSLSSLYSITLMLNGTPFQPDGKIRIKIKIVEDLKNYRDLQVVYIAGDGTISLLESRIEGEYITFVVDHVSHYGIIGTPVDTESFYSRFYGMLVTVLFISAILFIGIIILVLFKRRKPAAIYDYEEEEDGNKIRNVDIDMEEKIKKLEEIEKEIEEKEKDEL